ncbi:MAG: tetratricopeptide repeat protein [Acidobacteria bacterium]|nr:tetratricopeptide repeat protein [Acidobacteriota bacterium]
MRKLLLSIILPLVFVAGVSAQIDLSKRHFALGFEFAAAGEFESAIGAYQRSLQIAEASSGAELKRYMGKIHYNIGVCAYKLKNLTKAERHFSAAIVIDPVEDSKKYFSLAVTQIDQKKFDDAKKTLRALLRNDESHGEAWFELGMIYVSERKIEAAKAAFERSAQINGIRRPDAINNIGVILAMEGDLRSAARVFEKAYFASGQRLFAAKKNFEYCLRHSNDGPIKLVSTLTITGKEDNKNG